jgi:uncharacterized protein (TIGR00288 family)
LRGELGDVVQVHLKGLPASGRAVVAVGEVFHENILFALRAVSILFLSFYIHDCIIHDSAALAEFRFAGYDSRIQPKGSVMKDMDSDKKIAVLIDAENASHKVLGAVLTELSKHGHIIVKKAYGDWSSKHLVNWKQPLNDLAINPVQQFSYTQGKNSSDAAMIIDAMDLLYTGNINAFALVTSDSDFTKLASRLKESQIYVFGVGEKKTPQAFRSACDDFILTGLLEIPEEEEEVATRTPSKKTAKKTVAKDDKQQSLKQNTKLVSILRDAVTESADDDGWARASSCGSLIKRQYSDFDPRNYGFKSFPLLFEGIGLFDIDRRKTGSGNTMFVKDKKK